MIPRWKPESARMCDPPLFLKASVIVSGISCLSPVMRALMTALVVLCSNFRLSICSARLSARPVIPDDVPVPLMHIIMSDDPAKPPQKNPAAAAAVLFSMSFPALMKGLERSIADRAAAARKNVHVPDIQAEKKVLKPVVKYAPAAKGNANPAMSLSSIISLRIFAKVGIIFLTLRGLTEKSELINPKS